MHQTPRLVLLAMPGMGPPPPDLARVALVLCDACNTAQVPPRDTCARYDPEKEPQPALAAAALAAADSRVPGGRQQAQHAPCSSSERADLVIFPRCYLRAKYLAMQLTITTDQDQIITVDVRAGCQGSVGQRGVG